MRKVQVTGLILSALVIIGGSAMTRDRAIPIEPASIPVAVPVSTATIPTPTIMPDNVLPPLTFLSKVGKTYICLVMGESVYSNWPIDEVMQEWNGNGKVLFAYNADRCSATVSIVQMSNPDITYWGLTETFDDSYIQITLNASVPAVHRRHVICHELGHVLGLAHTTNVTCMNTKLYVPQPSAAEIEAAAENLNSWGNPTRQVGGN